jgi:hypothetical protein
MPLLYRIQREQEGGFPAPLNTCASIEDVGASIRLGRQPGLYGIYEHPAEGPPQPYGPPKWGDMVLCRNGRLWSHPEADPRRMHFWRDDNWSIYLVDRAIHQWQLCQPDGDRLPETPFLPNAPIERVLEWAEGEIARLEGLTNIVAGYRQQLQTTPFRGFAIITPDAWYMIGHPDSVTVWTDNGGLTIVDENDNRHDLRLGDLAVISSMPARIISGKLPKAGP